MAQQVLYPHDYDEYKAWKENKNKATFFGCLLIVFCMFVGMYVAYCTVAETIDIIKELTR